MAYSKIVKLVYTIHLYLICSRTRSSQGMHDTQPFLKPAEIKLDVSILAKLLYDYKCPTEFFLQMVNKNARNIVTLNTNCHKHTKQ